MVPASSFCKLGIKKNEIAKLREAAKKVLFLVARPLRGGPLRKKELKQNIYFSPKIEAGPLKKNFFCGFPNLTLNNF